MNLYSSNSFIGKLVEYDPQGECFKSSGRDWVDPTYWKVTPLPLWDYTLTGDHIYPTNNMIPGLKPFTTFKLSLKIGIKNTFK